MTDPKIPPVSAADGVPRHTTPTWEVELLISGVAVFAMLQLPGWLDDRLFALRPRFDANVSDLLFVMYVYMKGAAVILAVTFAAHLLLRAQWIALVGMHSVFPDGIRWERLRMGPEERALHQRRYGSAETAIERADNRATVVFAIGVMLATHLLVICVLVMLTSAAGLALASVTGLPAIASALSGLAVALLILPWVLAKTLDQKFSERLPANGWMRRLLAAVLRFYSRIGLIQSGLMTLLSSNVGERRMIVLMASIFFAVVLFVMSDFGTLKTPQWLGSYALFPHLAQGSARSIDPATYDDQRDPLHASALPYVQSAIVSGPYLQLVVPYQPARDDPALRHLCTAALALSDADARATAILDCLAGLHPVSLDGHTLPALHYDAGRDPRTERPVVQAMIDVRDIAPGRHELRVTRAPAQADAVEKSDTAKDYVIAFWR